MIQCSRVYFDRHFQPVQGWLSFGAEGARMVARKKTKSAKAKAAAKTKSNAKTKSSAGDGQAHEVPVTEGQV